MHGGEDVAFLGARAAARDRRRVRRVRELAARRTQAISAGDFTALSAGDDRRGVVEPRRSPRRPPRAACRCDG